MACASCSSGKDGSPAGCRSNGSCNSGGCNKLNVYNWLTDMVLPSGQQPYDIVEVRFKGSRKEFFRNKEVPELKVGDVVAVESSPGHDIGIVSMIGELVRFQLRKKGMDENSEGIRALYRVAKPNEIEKWNELREKESIMMLRSRSVIQLLHLNMKLSDVEFQGDGKKATFYYTADERVDFRELINAWPMSSVSVSRCVRSACARKPADWVVWVFVAWSCAVQLGSPISRRLRRALLVTRIWR